MERQLQDMSDDELIGLYLENNEEAIAVLLSRRAASVERWIRFTIRDEETVKDLYQEIMVHLLLKIQQRAYHSGCFVAWLYSLVSNYLCSHYRKKRLSVAVNIECECLQMVDEGMPEGYEEALFCLAELLSCLPLPMQELIKMRYWERMSYREIACRTGINSSTVVKRIQIGCRELRRMMEEKGYDSSCFWEI